MKIYSRLFGSLVFISASVASIAMMQPSWMRVFKSRSAMRSVTRCEMPPDESFVVKVNRMSAKERIIKRLIAEELDLFEAAAWFSLLNETPKAFPDRHWRNLPGSCDGEKHCRQVILWVRSQLEGTVPQSQIEASTQRLEELLQRHIDFNGKVHLPLQ